MVRRRAVPVCCVLLAALLSGCAGELDRKAEFRQLLEQYISAYNAHDAETVAKLYDENAVLVYPDSREPRFGRQEVLQGLRQFFRAFPDIRMNYSFFMADSNNFAVEGTWRGTHTGPLGSSAGALPPTGRQVEMRFAMIVEIGEHGLIVSDRGYYNVQRFIQQLYPEGVPAVQPGPSPSEN